MKFNSTQDINAPLEFVFQQASDFQRFETFGLRAGAKIKRTDNLSGTQKGMHWLIKADVRGKERAFDISLKEFDTPRHLEVLSTVKGFIATATIDLMELSKTQTRMKITLDVKPQSISARLLIQSAKLARSSLNRKYNARVEQFAKHIEQEYANRAAA